MSSVFLLPLPFSAPFVSQRKNFSSLNFSETFSHIRVLDRVEGLHHSSVKTDCSSPEPSFYFLLGHSEVELSALLDCSPA